ncbi:MAG: SDR family NAD(P)-dependent oxidoreductase [Gammaproteobacteria bacterium]
MLEFNGRVAIVTGAGRGIGRAHALLLAARGAAVVVNDYGVATDGSGASPAPAEQVAGEIRAAGGRAIANVASVATEDGARSIVAAALDAFGALDILVNNAGIAAPAPFDQTRMETFRRLMDVHFFGTVAMCQAAWPYLLASDAGRLLNTTSSSILGLPHWSGYAAAKGAVFAFTRCLATEAAATRVRVNMLAPGAGTRMVTDAIPDGPTRDWMLGSLPPHLVAPVAAWLVHQSCTLNGELLAASAGQVRRYRIGETDGFGDPQLTPEDVAANMPALMAQTSFHPWSDTEQSLPGR